MSEAVFEALPAPCTDDVLGELFEESPHHLIRAGKRQNAFGERCVFGNARGVEPTDGVRLGNGVQRKPQVSQENVSVGFLSVSPVPLSRREISKHRVGDIEKAR
jgi:hypothetical protein